MQLLSFLIALAVIMLACSCCHYAHLIPINYCLTVFFVATCTYMNMTDFNNTLDMHVCFFEGLVCTIHWLLLLASSIHIVSKAVV